MEMTLGQIGLMLAQESKSLTPQQRKLMTHESLMAKLRMPVGTLDRRKG